MLLVRPAQDRGHSHHSWLESHHSFSFADYYDARFNGFRDLRVLNEDHIAPAHGFAIHPHRDMEIITFVTQGSLEHRDSLGNGGVLSAGEVQHMSAGRGIRHSEFNHSKTEPLHLFQIWVVPNRSGVDPEYAQQRTPIREQQDQLHLVVSPDGRNGSLTMHSNTQFYIADLHAGATVRHAFLPERFGWLQVARGSVTLNEFPLHQGDAVAVSQEDTLSLTANEDAEILLFDLP